MLAVFAEDHAVELLPSKKLNLEEWGQGSPSKLHLQACSAAACPSAPLCLLWEWGRRRQLRGPGACSWEQLGAPGSLKSVRGVG